MDNLDYNQFSINIVGACMVMGLYMTLPVLGYFSDSHGPVLLAIISLILCPGYFLASAAYRYRLNYTWMGLAFFLIGCGTSSAYFCSLLTCAKIYPERKGLSISLPVTFYGLSSLVLANLFKLPVFKTSRGDIDILKVFTALALLYLVLGVFNWISSIIVTIEKEIVYLKIQGESGQREEEGLEDDESTPLLNSQLLEPETQGTKFRHFLSSPSTKLLYMALFFLAGPLEIFVTNLGSLTAMVGDVSKNDVATQVNYFSICSTMTRLLMGAATDLLGTIKSTTLLLVSGIAVATLSFFLIAIDYSHFSVITGLVGIGYGSTFTLFPTLIATVWGVEILGSTWGLFLSAPAFGSLVFGMFYAFEFDRYCDISITSWNVYCLTFPFALFAAGFALSGVLVYFCWRLYWHTSRLTLENN
ncbi:hypothetical protein KL930_001569 [Ogataea haglerorum]|uniref:Probable transporter MCH1 n=1 Tax=Ogataea haglerorum TaxID=1937702 RepID=A0AAN6HZ64_9ASCO|nr:uncharacterized protein KL911_004415 [Ogataea haglerorum]KAG7692069.1 hypothetical protein KL915_004829 [Ogataea haglerorum]KAG7698791.1 hypothetical protein KL951_002055 [Ogataea haglerorum]KAG7703679.1 hypothetical protein KL914_004636 [Ogataea haglerorum]KAG7704074.1 hypothetical protein KL950_004401 [Ogataea haglerorum]KAG7724341.1 hypothetical protein KL933_004845 [Ogataea haglerorum]